MMNDFQTQIVVLYTEGLENDAGKPVNLDYENNFFP